MDGSFLAENLNKLLQVLCGEVDSQPIDLQETPNTMDTHTHYTLTINEKQKV